MDNVTIGTRVLHAKHGWGSVHDQDADGIVVAFDKGGVKAVPGTDLLVQQSFLPTGERVRWVKAETKAMEEARTEREWSAAKLLRDLDRVVMEQIDRLDQNGFLANGQGIREAAMALREVVAREARGG